MGRTELGLAARPLEEDDEITRNCQCRGTTQILFYQRQREVDAGGHACRSPD